MTLLPGYEGLNKIEEGLDTVVYRGHRLRDHRSVILKVPKAPYPLLPDIAQLQREYEIASSLNIDGILKPTALEQFDLFPVLVMEDFDGQTIRNYASQFHCDPATFLRFAIRLTDILGQIHQTNLIHNHLNPDNILCSFDAKEVKVIGLGGASRLSGERTTPAKASLQEGMLPYLSPEQTGRMNRAVDYRTDFYSLGIIFYELLAGQLPFSFPDPLELVHAHIAKQPKPLHELNPQIPIPVGEIVMKLMAKMAEDRYQSAHGLKADLEKCLAQLATTGQVASFPLGQNDISDRFQVSQKLYGREKEISVLVKAFENASRGKSTLMLVSGYSGIGKSTLVNEVQKAIVQLRGIFISGKFDLLHREVPYSALIQAFQALIHQILTESEEQISRWRKELLEAVGQIGQVVVDVIPEVALIIGQQPALPHLAPTEAQNRFMLVFKRFVRVFARQEHPLVIFVDDLQWVGAATVTLLMELVSDSDLRHLFVIGGYRDNEVNAAHPLMMAISELEKSGVRVRHLKLQPLNLENVNQLIADTLHCSIEESLPFAQLVLEKTDGNPFFVSQVLQSLYHEGLFQFDYQQRRWRWDLKRIQAVQITDNVVDLMIQKLQKLPALSQRCAQLAASIGNRFDLCTLATVAEKSTADTADDLWPVAHAGLIQPAEGWNRDHACSGSSDRLKEEIPNLVYRFLHDRVQQAAYALIPADQRQTTHLKIGRLLLREIGPDELEDKIFELTHHLNIGAALITDSKERIQLAELNLRAGKKAKSAAAYETALSHFRTGMQLLPESSWQRNYDLCLALYVEATEAAYMNTDFASSEAYANVVLEQAKTLLDKVKIFELQMQAYISRNQMIKAVGIGLGVLGLLGVTLQTDIRDEHLDLPQIEELEHLPVMIEPERLAAMRILVALAPPSFQTMPEIFPQVIRMQIQYTMTYGLSALAAVSYGLYGFLLLSGPNEDIAAGYQAGQIALRLLELFNAKELKSKVLFIFNGHIRHWQDHAETTIEPFNQGIRSGLESGDLQFVGYNAKDLCTHMFFMGKPLQEVADRMADLVSLLKNIKQEHSTYYVQIWQQAVLNLLDQGNSRTLLSGPVFDADALIPKLVETNNRNLLFITYLAQAMLHYLYREFEQAVYKAELAAEHEESSAGLMNVGPHNYFSSLAMLAHFPKASPDEQKRFLAKVEVSQRRMRSWTGDNYHHAYQLVEAEKARVLGQTERAMANYDDAISSAIKNRFINIQALANERAAIFYQSLGRERIAQWYLQEAHFAYMRWGATAKVKDLEQNFAHLLSAHHDERRSLVVQAGEALVVDMPAAIKDETSLDLLAVLESSQAISSEIMLEKLLAKLVKIVIENAGAEKAFLLLEQKGELFIQASGKVDRDMISMHQGPTAVSDEQLSTAVVNYVRRTGENLVLTDATSDPRFGNCAYIAQHRPKSLLCMPVRYHNSIIGILYLENNLTTDAFTPERIRTLQILASQAAISLENARLYAEINREAQVRQRAEEVLRTITEGTAAVTGKDFFRSLLRLLTSAFNAREAFIAECTEQNKRRARKLVLLKDGEFREQHEYDLAGTPCEAVVRGETRYYPRNLTRLCPKADGRESYLGAPLFDSSGQVLGHLAILDDKPMDLDPQARAIFEIFTARAGVELERKKSEDALRISEQHLRQLNEQLEDYSRNLEHKVAERTHEIERSRRVAESLRGILTVLNSNRTQDEIQSYIVSEASGLFASDNSAIYHFDRQESLFRLQSVRGQSAHELRGRDFPRELGEMIRRGRPVVVSNLNATTLRMNDNVLKDLAGNRALLAVPLVVSGDTYGCLALYYAQERLFSQEEIAMAVAFGDQAALAIENDRLRNLVKQATVIEERSRLARELHDSVTQSIYSLTLLAEGWQRMAMNGELADVAGPLAELGEIAQQALKEMRLLIYELRPPGLDQEGLLGALHQRLAVVEKRAGVEARLLAQEIVDLPAPIEEGLYRIAQEALNNTLKHAAATSVTVRLDTDDQGLVLQIADNGRGFDIRAASNHQGGIGLASMRERVERLSGSLEIRSTPGKGTTVLVRLPLMDVSNE